MTILFRSFILFLLLFLMCDPYPSEIASPRYTILSESERERSVFGSRGSTVFYPEYHALSGNQLLPGPDPYGYDYREHSYRGFFSNRDLGSRGIAPVEADGVRLKMRWNDSWLSNKDRDGDGMLDRHAGLPNYRGSGAWLTVHLEGKEAGKTWEYVMKAAAVPRHALWENGRWKADSEILGPAIWGCFAVIMEFSTGSGSRKYTSEFKRRFPGLGLE